MDGPLQWGQTSVNAPTVGYQSAAWQIAGEWLVLLDATDMPTLKPVKSSNKDFPSVGLESGIFTNNNRFNIIKTIFYIIVRII